jgi:hypothetical protein
LAFSENIVSQVGGDNPQSSVNLILFSQNPELHCLWTDVFGMAVRNTGQYLRQTGCFGQRNLKPTKSGTDLSQKS